MAFASLGVLFDANDKTSISSWAPVTSTAISVDEFLLVIIGLDNLGTSDAETSQVTAVSIGSNTLTKAVEYTNGSPGAANGATVSIWYGTATAAASSGASASISLSGLTTCKGIVGQRFSRDTGKTVQVMAGTKATGEAKSITSGTITNAVEALLIRGLAIEDNERAISAGATTNWQAINDASAFTTGGGATANVACGAEFRIMTGAGAGVTSNPSSTSSGDMASAVIAFEEVSAGARTLTCTTASYTITGTAVSTEWAQVLPAATASYTISGTNVTLAKGKTLVASAGSYAITGTAAAFNRSYVLAAATASYVISGTAALVEFGRKLVAGSGSYAITGTAAVFPRGKQLIASAGSYAITGTAAAFKWARNLVAASGTYTITGTAAVFRRALRLVAASGSYAITGTNAAFRRVVTLVASTDSYVLTGTNAVLTFGVAARTLVASAGSYVLTGANAILSKASIWTEVPGASGTWTPSSASGVWTEVPGAGGTWT